MFELIIAGIIWWVFIKRTKTDERGKEVPRDRFKDVTPQPNVSDTHTQMNTEGQGEYTKYYKVNDKLTIASSNLIENKVASLSEFFTDNLQNRNGDDLGYSIQDVFRTKILGEELTNDSDNSLPVQEEEPTTYVDPVQEEVYITPATTSIDPVQEEVYNTPVSEPVVAVKPISKPLPVAKHPAFTPSNTPRGKGDYVAIDLETTGFSDMSDRIIEIGAIKYINHEEADRLHIIVRPNTNKEVGMYSVKDSVKIGYKYYQYASDFIVNLTGITNEEIHNGVDEGQAIIQLLEFIDNYPLLGHNIEVFDSKFINQLCKRYDERPIANTLIDTLVMARQKYSRTFRDNKLQTIAEYYNVTNGTAHNALADAETTQRIYVEMLKGLGEYETQ